MNTKHLLKAANSKGQLVGAVMMYQKALLHYANEANWAVKGDVIQWVGSDDPTEVAEIVLGKRRPVTGQLKHKDIKLAKQKMEDASNG